jgi:hypothetical protein
MSGLAVSSLVTGFPNWALGPHVRTTKKWAYSALVLSFSFLVLIPLHIVSKFLIIDVAA